MTKYVLLLSGILMSAHQMPAQDDFYDVTTIQEIEVFFADDNWDYQLDTAKLGADEFTLADSVRINGQTYEFVGVKYKGNSSYDSTFAKNPLHISLDEFVEQEYQGHSSIKLSNAYADPSMVREVLAYELLRNYMHAPRSNFARIYVNGVYLGLYSNDEHIGNNFCESHFLSPNGILIKGNPMVTPGPTTKSNLRYIDADSSSYLNYYDLKTDYGWNALVDLCDVVSNNSNVISESIDVDRVLWMLAFNSVMVNLDSYSGVFAQNYYLYQDTSGRFNPIVWDLNMCFGGFPFLGSGNSSMGSLTIANMQQLPVVVHANDSYWPLIKALMNEPLYRRMYLAHVRTIASEMIESNAYALRASDLQAIISQSVAEDTHKFYSDVDFQQAMQTPVSIGNYDVPGIAQLMDARMDFLSADTEFSLQAPEIVNWQTSTNLPNAGATFYVITTVSGAQNVWLGKRYSTAAHFSRVPMYDDGFHNDGNAGDGVCGVEVMMLGDSMQYYIYAEDADAGVFSPARAEHEFHVVYAAGLSVDHTIQTSMGGVYPNPSNGLLNFRSSENEAIDVSVYDMCGACVMRFVFPAGKTNVELGNLSAGTYLLHWNNEHQLIQIAH